MRAEHPSIPWICLDHLSCLLSSGAGIASRISPHCPPAILAPGIPPPSFPVPCAAMATAFSASVAPAATSSPLPRCSLAAFGRSSVQPRANRLVLASTRRFAKEHIGASPALSMAASRPSSSSRAAFPGAREGPLAVPRAAFGVEGKNVLVVNTSSGGHAIIGFWLAKRLRGFGHSVTVLTVGEESSPQMEKAPFNRFAELREVGVRTVWGEPGSLSESLGVCDPFDVVLDNNGKDMAAVKPVVDWAQEREVKQFLFVSSAGIYKSTTEPPHIEGDAVKSDAGHTEVEQYIQSKFWANGWAAFRPEYITGSGNNKDCEEWFFDRIVRDRPVPIPAPGIQLTVITHAADIADIITSAVNDHEAAAGSVFNAVSGRAVTFDGLVRLCARAAGMEPKIVHYDPAAVGVDAKKAFPFRNTHFYAEPRAIREKLGWSSVLSLDDILDARFEEYVSKGRYEKEMTFEMDDKILAAVGKSV